jgi:tRNA (cmo5U34)-methyltransferase
MTNFFNGPVPEFDDHIRKSIPTVDAMYDLCHALTHALSQECTRVVDLGCSTGRFLRDTPKRRNTSYVGVDFVDWKWKKTPRVTFKHDDVLTFLRDTASVDTSVVLSLFTLQFMPFSERDEVIRRVSDCLVEGGIFILAEKVHLPSAGVSEVVERSLIQWKRVQFTDKEVLDKSAKLAMSMRRSTFEGLYATMQEHFNSVNIVWANGAFVCMVGVK